MLRKAGFCFGPLGADRLDGSGGPQVCISGKLSPQASLLLLGEGLSKTPLHVLLTSLRDLLPRPEAMSQGPLSWLWGVSALCRASLSQGRLIFEDLQHRLTVMFLSSTLTGRISVDPKQVPHAVPGCPGFPYRRSPLSATHIHTPRSPTLTSPCRTAASYTTQGGLGGVLALSHSDATHSRVEGG